MAGAGSRNCDFNSQAAEGKAFFGYLVVSQRLGILRPDAERHCNTANNVLQVFSFV